MALKIYEKFAPRANVGDTNYPNGSIKNESAPGAKDGTPLDADWGNDYAGFDAALFAEAGMTPNGDPDTVLSSQRLVSLVKLHGITMNLSDAINSENISEGGFVIVSDRNYSMFDVVLVSSVTPNGDDVIQCVTQSTLALKFRRIADPIGVDDIQSMIETDLTSGQTVMTQGGANKGDGARSTYLIVPGGTDPINNVTLNNGKEAFELLLDSSHVVFGNSNVASELIGLNKKNNLINNSMNTTLNSINGWRANEGFTAARVWNHLGDSISYGAGADNGTQKIEDNSFVRIYQKMMNIQFGSNQYGFISSYPNDGTGTERHTMSETGTWGFLNGAAASHLPNGWARTSSDAGATLSFNIGSFNRKAKVWFDGTLTGSFKVTLNNTTDILTVTTDGTGTGLDFSSLLDLLDSGTGALQIRVEVISGNVAITGMEYLDSDLEFRLNNYSRDGRAGKDIDESVIEAMCKGCYGLTWAMGANDRSGSAQDNIDYSQRIDWLIQYCNQYSTRLLVLDFLFTDPDSNHVRVELKRLADSVNGAVHIPFPNLITTNGQVQTGTYLIDTINFSYDAVHLTWIGHRLVAEAIAEYLNLAVKSKAQAEQLDSSWMPMRLINGAVNLSSSIDFISKYRFNNNTLECSYVLPLQAHNTIISNLDLKGRKIPNTRNYPTNLDASGNNQIISATSTGSLVVFDNPASPALAVNTVGFNAIETNSINISNRYY